MSRQTTEGRSEAVKSRHPLDPLSASEIARVTEILRDSGRIGAQARIVSICLNEPPKEEVYRYGSGAFIDRQAFVIVLDKADGTAIEMIVSLSDRCIRSAERIEGLQPPLMAEEFALGEAAIKADPAFQEALRRHGIEQIEHVMIDTEPVGGFTPERYQGRRLAWGAVWYRDSEDDNGYAHPVGSVIPIIDLNTYEVLEIEEYEPVPVPMASGDLRPAAWAPLRNDLRPLQISQPEGVSFSVDGWEVRWQKWSFRVGFTPREGLVLHRIGYHDGDQVRPILYRAAINELYVPYGEPGPTQYRKNFFDAGEIGLGVTANALQLGCDCLGEIHYFDAVIADNDGNPVTLPNAICLHEEDYSLLWKHFDARSGDGQVRRSRRLAISFVATLGNYDYAFYWYFYQDGSIEAEVKLNGILGTAALRPGEIPKHGRVLAPGINGTHHQHFFSARLDFDIDGADNAVYESNSQAVQWGDQNPYGNAYIATATLLENEQAAQRLIDPLNGRHWRIVNRGVTNGFDEPTGYRLIPGENVLPFAQPDSPTVKRAGFITKHLWVTPFMPREIYAAGDYPNQHPGGAGLPEWTSADREIVDRDIVVWYTMGSHHSARPEDWPVMPSARIGFMLKPDGFFNHNPAMDAPVPVSGDQSACSHDL
jgi:primary-amine oxidase